MQNLIEKVRAAGGIEGLSMQERRLLDGAMTSRYKAMEQMLQDDGWTKGPSILAGVDSGIPYYKGTDRVLLNLQAVILSIP